MNIRIKLSSFILPAFTLLLFAMTYWLFGFYYETNDEVQMELFFRGITVPEGSWDLYYWHRFSGIILTHLYSCAPDVPWYGLFLYFLLYLATINYFIILKTFLSNIGKWTQYFIFTLFFFLILFENVINLNFLRVTLNLCMSGYLIFICMCIRSKLYYKNVLFFLYCFFCVSMAIQIRPEGGFLLLFIFALFSGVFIFLNKIQYGIYISGLLLVLFSVGIILAFNYINTSVDQKSDEAIIPHIQTLYNYDIPHNITTTDDSLKVQIITDGYFWDQNVITKQFLNKITPNRNLLNVFQINFNSFIDSAKHLGFIWIKNNLPLITVYLFILFSFCVFLYRTRRKTIMFQYLSTQVLYFIFIIILDIYYKMPHRLYTPLITLVFLVNTIFWLIINFDLCQIPKFMVKFFVLIFMTAAIIYCIKLNSKIDFLKSRKSGNYKYLADMDAFNHGKVIVFNKHAIFLFNGLDPLKTTPLSDRNNYIIWGWFNWYSSYKKFLFSLSGEKNFLEIMKYVLSRDHMFLSSDENVQTLKNHINRFYNENIVFQKMSNSILYTEPTYNYKLYDYLGIDLK